MITIQTNAGTYHKKFQVASNIFPSYLKRAIQEAGATVKDAVNDLTPTKTGTLRRGTTLESKAFESIIRNETPYGMAVERGAKPHFITPRNGMALRFLVGGKWVFAPEVHHPGFKGRWFFKKGLSSSKEKILAIFKKWTNLSNILKKA